PRAAEHYAVHSPIVQPHTVFYQRIHNGRLHLPAQEQEAEMYEPVMRQMSEAGIRQYAIRNFAKPGYESQHNLTYWS
ncbi:radical SAM family heme chaperone HemW, partial [Bacillus velezensis]